MEGKRHDAGMLRMSGLLDLLEAHCNTAAGEPQCIYGDPAYPLERHLQSSYREGNLSDKQRAFNSSMSSVRVSVEWVFGDIRRYFAFVNFKHNLKIGLCPIGKIYIFCLFTVQECSYLSSWFNNKFIS